MDVKAWSKDQTKNRDDAVVNLPADSGWQPAPRNRFRQSAGVAIRILLAWLSLEVTGLRYAVGMSRDALLVGAGITLFIVILRYFYVPMRIWIAALIHRLPIPEESITAQPDAPESQTDFAEGSYDQVYVGDDGELVYALDQTAKPKREGL
jgi:hypothetical protein